MFLGRAGIRRAYARDATLSITLSPIQEPRSSRPPCAVCSSNFGFVFAACRSTACFPLLQTPGSTSAFEAPHLRVELLAPAIFTLADRSSTKPAFISSLEPGWHVYWQNPGDSGEPPQIHWALPEGSPPAVTVSRAEASAPRPADGLWLRERSPLSVPLQVAKACKARPRRSPCQGRLACLPRSLHSGQSGLGRSVQILSRRANGSDLPVRRPELWKRLARSLPQPLPDADHAVFQPTPTGFRLAVETGQRETQAAVFPRRPGHSRQSCTAKAHAHGNGPDSRSQEGREPLDRAILRGVGGRARTRRRPGPLRYP